MKNIDKGQFIHIRLDDELHQRLKIEAAVNRTSITKIIGKAAQNYLNDHSLVSNQ